MQEIKEISNFNYFLLFVQYALTLMELDHQNQQNDPQEIKQEKALNLQIQIIPVEDHYLIDFQANLNPLYANLFVNQTFILFVLELRTGMTPRAVNVLRGCILEFCQEALDKGLNRFGFIINGEYFTIKKPNYEAIKEILTLNMKISKEDNYLMTLIKLRHILQNEIYKYDRNIEYLDIVFFTSFVEIDHSLGVKKRSYIDQLNEHSDDCSKQVDRIHAVLSKLSRYNVHVIGLEKQGEKDQDYSLVDRDLFYKIHTQLGGWNSIIVLCWVEEQDLFLIFKAHTETHNPDSFTKMIQGFKSISSTVLSGSLSFQIDVPVEKDQKVQKYQHCYLNSTDTTKFRTEYDAFYKRKDISLQKIKDNGVKIKSVMIQNKLKDNQMLKKQVPVQELYEVRSCYTQLSEKDIQFQIQTQVRLFNFKLNRICQELKEQIVGFKRIYLPNNKSILEMTVNEEKQLQLKDEIFYIEKRAKQIYQQIFDSKLFPNENQAQCQAKRQCFELYSSLKKKLDVAQEVLLSIYKKQIKNDEIGKISQAVTYWGIRNSLKNKLIRRINLNPKMIDQTYAKIHEIVQNSDYSSLQTINKQAKHAIGTCIKSGINFATALRKEDCLGILIEIQRPDAAIADPGRIRIRQISPFSMSVSNFFNVYHYGIDHFGRLDDEKGGEWVRQYAKLQKQNYQQMWDYWALTEKKFTVTAIVPVYLCQENWKVAKLLMKPCLGWAATGQPLGYTFSQAQNIPFMVLSFAIRRVQQLKYEIETLERKFEKNEFKVTEFSQLQRDTLDKKLLKKRMEDLCWVLEQTCFQIMKDMSGKMFEQKLSEIVTKKYLNYFQYPIQRTIDVISNNSAFMSQLYCVIKLGIIKKPEQKQYHQFFKRLIEEELRRQTDGWNEEETQDKFINKLLNSEVQKMDTPEYVVLNSDYYDNFQQLKKGEIVHKTYFQITRDELAMMITKNGKFNDTQRMLLIEYKRLYQNRVLWMWYIRFRLYQEIDRLAIHKWKCLDLHNSYMLFTLIIQNKKQRKNYKRRQAILRNQYVDPFDEEKARQFLELEFMRLRGNKQRQNLQILNNKKYGNAAATFVYSPSLQEAAGTLINFDIGQQCSIFFRELQRGEGVRLEEKLRMLLLGDFKNVELFRGWRMSRKKNNRLRCVYPQLFLKYGYMF